MEIAYVQTVKFRALHRISKSNKVDTVFSKTQYLQNYLVVSVYKKN